MNRPAEENQALMDRLTHGNLSAADARELMRQDRQAEKPTPDFLAAMAPIAFPLLAAEFPDYPADQLPDIPASWSDASWHNDASPYFIASPNVGVYVDFPAEYQRECAGGSRFIVCRMQDSQMIVGPQLLESDDWNQVLSACIAAEFVANLQQALSPDEWAQTCRLAAAHKDTGTQFCDSNMLMNGAFESIIGREPQIDEHPGNRDAALWSAAWEIAAREAGAASDPIGAELLKWISGREIARRTVDAFGTTLVVVQCNDGPDRFDLLRGFSAAGSDSASVSVDLQGKPLADLLDKLLSGIAKGESVQ